jgi:hypothetical protein
MAAGICHDGTLPMQRHTEHVGKRLALRAPNGNARGGHEARAGPPEASRAVTLRIGTITHMLGPAKDRRNRAADLK